MALKDFFLLLGIFIWIFAIVGMQQFGGASAFSCDVNSEICRSNFDTLWEALYTAFQILTSESILSMLCFVWPYGFGVPLLCSL